MGGLASVRLSGRIDGLPMFGIGLFEVAPSTLAPLAFLL
jgi:hypothetical protein